jgi:hypothetical protein
MSISVKTSDHLDNHEVTIGDDTLRVVVKILNVKAAAAACSLT